MPKHVFEPIAGRAREFLGIFLNFMIGRFRVHEPLAHTDCSRSSEVSKLALRNLADKTTECQ